MALDLYGNKPISKRALEMKDIADKFKTLWRAREGTFENIFRLLSYLIPFVPGLGWGVFILERVATAFGWGMADFGGAIDKELGTISNVTYADFSEAVTNVIEKKKEAAFTEEDIIKVAWIGGLMKLIMGIPRAAQLVWKAIKALLFMFGVTHVGDLVAKMTDSTEPIGTALLEQVKQKEDDSGLLDVEQLSGLTELIKDPTKLIRPFI